MCVIQGPIKTVSKHVDVSFREVPYWSTGRGGTCALYWTGGWWCGGIDIRQRTTLRTRHTTRNASLQHLSKGQNVIVALWLNDGWMCCGSTEMNVFWAASSGVSSLYFVCFVCVWVLKRVALFTLCKETFFGIKCDKEKRICVLCAVNTKINGQDVEFVESYKYLDAIIENKLNFDCNANMLWRTKEAFFVWESWWISVLRGPWWLCFIDFFVDFSLRLSILKLKMLKLRWYVNTGTQQKSLSDFYIRHSCWRKQNASCLTAPWVSDPAFRFPLQERQNQPIQTLLHILSQ